MAILKIAKVAVENAAFSFDKMFEYVIPVELESKATKGKRVLVPFGQGNRKRIGMIFEVGEAAVNQKLKALTAVMDEQPVLTDEQLNLSKWLKRRTFCTYYDAIKVMLPSGINLKLKDSYQVNTNMGEQAFFSITDEEKRLINYLSRAKAAVSCQRLLENFGYVDNQRLDDMVSRGLLRKIQQPVSKIGDKTARMARLSEEPLLAYEKLTPKQKLVVDLLTEVGSASVKEICYFTGVTNAVITKLVENGTVVLFDIEVLRNPYGGAQAIKQIEELVLTAEQQAAYDGLLSLIRQNKPHVALLFGITGSGKTQVFLKLIDQVVKAGRQVIVMVPEISLTPQTVEKFHSYFGDMVAVLHSGLSLGERLDEWKRIRNGSVQVVIGTRSAVFAPFQNIGLIIMDEEQEHTYKSEGPPRFHAREVAKFRCTAHNAVLLLASATPSLETYYHARSGRYQLFTLHERYGDAVLPQVSIIDMNNHSIRESGSIFSDVMVRELCRNLENKQQSILLYNRRGYHTIASCVDCGTVISCPHCSIALTYHKKNARLMCHYCGYSEEYCEKCSHCGSNHIRYSGQGTQRIEDELAALFPTARVLRMDMDTTHSRYSHEEHFKAFEQGEFDILVGTQMVAKGLNFPNVTLVGVLSADQTLYANDFKGYERAFSLITQVVGRSGRGELAGRAFIQTYTPQNPVITLAAMQDYEGFFEQEIINRKVMLYPPFCDICIVGFSGMFEAQVKQGAERFVVLLRELVERRGLTLPLRVLGPSPMGVVKVNNKYRYKLIIKCRESKALRDFLHELLHLFSADRTTKNVTVFADMNYEGSF